jgi:hypothetical protein
MDEEKELIMETKTKDMRLFHKLVRNNRKKGNDVIMDLNVNGITRSRFSISFPALAICSIVIGHGS